MSVNFFKSRTVIHWQDNKTSFSAYWIFSPLQSINHILREVCILALSDPCFNSIAKSVILISGTL